MGSFFCWGEGGRDRKGISEWILYMGILCRVGSLIGYKDMVSVIYIKKCILRLIHTIIYV